MMSSSEIKYASTEVMKLTMLILLFTLQAAFAYASESKLPEEVTGIWYPTGESENPEFSWEASWIWIDEAYKADAILGRHQIILDKIPDRAILRLTASSVYQLYINGKYICRGPARSASHHQSYDMLDITKVLKEGDNLIAVRVHHQEGKKSYQYDGRAGFLAQVNMEYDKHEILVTSDANWKAIADPSWDDNAPLISRFQQVVSDRVDLRKYLKGWNSLDYDDSSWRHATELMRKSGWPSPQQNARSQPLTPPWTSLIPRDIPYLIETDIVADKLIQSTLTSTVIDEGPIIVDGKRDIAFETGKTLELPAARDSKAWFLLFDFGTVINGMPRLDIEGMAGTKIKIVTAPFMVDNQFSKITVDSEFVDEIVLSGERDHWEATYFKPTRYLGILVRNESPVKLHSAGILGIRYPFDKMGIIESKDASWVKQYFDASAKTIDVCTTDGYTDNYREMRQYAQTGYYAALGNYYTFGDAELQRRYLIQTSQEQQANGMMPAYAPLASDDYMIILDSNCLWIRSLRNYLLYTGDFETTRALLPDARKLLDLLHSFTNKEGMIENPPYAYWLDHALNDRRGANLNLNGHYLGALEDFAQTLLWLEAPGLHEYTRRAELLRQSLQRNFWNEEKELFTDAVIDGRQSEMYSEHANAMALALNIATPEQARRIAGQLLEEDQHNYIKRASGITMVTPAMSYFLHYGLCNYGYIEASFNMFQSRFNRMLEPGSNGTLWEEWWLDAMGRTGKLQKGRTRSDAQTESAFPPALFAEFLLGVRPVAPGMREIIVKYQKSGLNHVKGNIPSPLGELRIEWQIKKNKTLRINVPEGMIVSVDLESLDIGGERSIRVNGARQEPTSNGENHIPFEGGEHLIEF